MTPQPLDCSAVIERLIGGERPGSDPLLAEHVGSCLGCFRTAGDLRGLPQLREQLLRAQGELPDPGAVFWSNFPAGVSAAWDQLQRRPAPAPEVVSLTPAPAYAPLPGRRERLGQWWAATRSWLERPVPAACAGALCAGIIALLVTRTPAVQELNLGALHGPAVAETSFGDPLSMTAGGLVLGGGIDDTIKDLDVGELQALRSELEASMASGAGDKPVFGQAPGHQHRQQLADGQAESSPTALSDELDELNEAGLAVLAENLGDPI